MSRRKKVKSQFESGTVYAIPLENGYSFCVVCVGNEFAFFDYLSKEAVIPDNLLNLPIAFRVFVGKGEPKYEKWIALGKVELPEDYLKHSSFLHKPVGSEEYFIYSNGESLPASEDEVKGLELFGIWFGPHIKDRLEEYYEGKPSSAVAAIKKQLGINF
ncbi:immunity 26/phosphotriesterase HocA family protein [Microbulbifer variabilis]|uniref:immunity 26/phosphotriesterase HocA family protein n=1 Tax=Microbulbifer variabilis TaxID=266805 RepID=UPI001CFEAE51|nr:immunity 26/phosphotriesterase HocA family protein [Microbulbifer variabilis]